jgi:excisionase family DNA binding protein
MLAMLRQVLTAVEDLRASYAQTRKEYYTVEEVGRLTGRSAYTVRRWLAEKKLTAIRVDGTGPRGRLLIPGEQLARLLPKGLGGALPAAALLPNGNRESSEQ